MCYINQNNGFGCYTFHDLYYNKTVACIQHFHLLPQLRQFTKFVMGSSAPRVCIWQKFVFLEPHLKQVKKPFLPSLFIFSSICSLDQSVLLAAISCISMFCRSIYTSLEARSLASARTISRQERGSMGVLVPEVASALFLEVVGVSWSMRSLNLSIGFLGLLRLKIKLRAF